MPNLPGLPAFLQSSRRINAEPSYGINLKGSAGKSSKLKQFLESNQYEWKFLSGLAAIESSVVISQTYFWRLNAETSYQAMVLSAATDQRKRFMCQGK